jgi:citrate lyase subunit beta/citryl-CoA lyase
MTHPNEALFGSGDNLPIIPSCEHFAGSEKLILKGFEMQKKLGPVFDITCDCEDGAETGKEVAHAEMIVRVVNSDVQILMEWQELEFTILIIRIGDKILIF